MSRSRHQKHCSRRTCLACSNPSLDRDAELEAVLDADAAADAHCPPLLQYEIEDIGRDAAIANECWCYDGQVCTVCTPPLRAEPLRVSLLEAAR